jgi:hypothetical protein
MNEENTMGCTNGIEPSSAGPQPAALPLSYAHRKKKRRKKTGALPLTQQANALIEIEVQAVASTRVARRCMRVLCFAPGIGANAEASGQRKDHALARLCRAHGDHPDRGVALAHGDSLVGTAAKEKTWPHVHDSNVQPLAS